MRRVLSLERTIDVPGVLKWFDEWFWGIIWRLVIFEEDNNDGWFCI